MSIGVSVYWPAGKLMNSKLPLASPDGNGNVLSALVSFTCARTGEPSALLTLPVIENVGCGVGVGVGLGFGSFCQLGCMLVKLLFVTQLKFVLSRCTVQIARPACATIDTP